MNKLKYIALVAALIFSAMPSFAQSGYGVLKKSSVFAVYIKAGYIYDTITNAFLSVLKSNDSKAQRDTLHKVSAMKIFGVNPSTPVDKAIKLIQENKFYPTGKLIFSISSRLSGTCLMDIKCNPESLPGCVQDFLEERGIKTELNNKELTLSMPEMHQKGKLTSSLLTIGTLAKENEKIDKSWQVFENASTASNTIIAIEADVNRIRKALYTYLSEEIRDNCEFNRSQIEKVLQRYNQEHEPIKAFNNESREMLKNYSSVYYKEYFQCPDNGEFQLTGNGVIACSLHGTKDNPKEHLSLPGELSFEEFDKYFSALSRIRVLGNTSKLQAMVCVTDENIRSMLKEMLKQQLVNLKNGVGEDNHNMPMKNKDGGFVHKIPEKGKPYFESGDSNRPPRPPSRHELQGVKDFASKINIIDKSPWLGIEIPDFLNQATNNPAVLGLLRPPMPPQPVHGEHEFGDRPPLPPEFEK